jgi:hypothetical protein
VDLDDIVNTRTDDDHDDDDDEPSHAAASSECTRPSNLSPPAHSV